MLDGPGDGVSDILNCLLVFLSGFIGLFMRAGLGFYSISQNRKSDGFILDRLSQCIGLGNLFCRNY